MNKINFLLIVFSIFSYGQNNYNTVNINYTEITDFGILAETSSTLEVNNTKSVYTRKKINYKAIDNDITIKQYKDTIANKEEVLEAYYSNSFNNIIYLKDRNLSQKLIVKDSIIDINWDIDASVNDQLFLGYNCKKATGKFRGRNYTVWFTTEIPIRFGPWKLHGLPGLVLKVQDDLNQILIQATEIIISKKTKIEFINLDDLEEISIKEHILLTKEKDNEFLNEVMTRVQSTMPRGTIIKDFEKDNSKNNRFEIKYEWEEEEKKKED